MEWISVPVAAVAGFVFGGVWYGTLAKPWMDAVGFSEAQIKSGAGKKPAAFLVSLLMLLLVAGMMRHAFVMAGVESFGKGALAGFGIGAFMATPWIVINHAYGMKPFKLTLIDGGFATIGCTVIGLVLGLF